MLKDKTSSLIARLRSAVLAGTECDLTDGQLLECFVRRRDEAAIAALIRRHGQMVWAVCGRVLCNHHDAEDAFQATFLVLVRKAASIMPREMVGNWLYGVANRTALKAKMTRAKRQAREKHVKNMPEPQSLNSKDIDLSNGLEVVLDQELSRLPDKYRVIIVLCDLEGKTRKEVARQLKIPEGTLSSRLTKARMMLAKRLARHGLAISSGMLGAVLSQKMASAGVPTSVASSTIRAVALVAAEQGATRAVSLKVAALTEGVLKTMLLSKLKASTGVLLVALVTLGSAGLVHRTVGHGLGEGQAKADQGLTKAVDEGPRNNSAPTSLSRAGKESTVQIVQRASQPKPHPGDQPENAPKLPDKKADAGKKAMWRLVRQEFKGEFVPPSNWLPVRWVIDESDNLTLTMLMGKNVEPDLSIYRVVDDELMVAVGQENRPKKFSTKEVEGAAYFVCVFKREPAAVAVASGQDGKKTSRQTTVHEDEKNQIRPGDRLQIKVINTLDNDPINGVFRVEPNGAVALGPSYGRVNVNGESLERAEVVIRNELRKVLKDPAVSVTRYDPLPDEGIQALEERVRRLEQEVQNLQATLRRFQEQKSK